MGERARILVLGGGLAGAAAAYGLARAGHAVTLLEREPRPGMHASGRNAGMIRQLTDDPQIARLARDGARLLADPPADLRAAFAGDPLRKTGSVLLAGGEAAEGLRRSAEDARAHGVKVTLYDGQALEALALFDDATRLALVRATPDVARPWLGRISPSHGAVAAHTPSDGVADPHAVLEALLKAAKAHGAEVRLGSPARLETSAGAVSGVALSDDTHLPADVVVNAAGPWADELAAAAGATPMALRSYRRHLFYTGPLHDVDPDAPWVWDVERGFYVRPESSGLLLCACDKELRPPEDTQADGSAGALLADRVAQVAPAYAQQSIARSWAGLRSFAPDDRFVVGFDPRLRGLFWLTALGGHGLTTSCALADLVAKGVARESDPALDAFDPARFAPVRA